MLAHDVRIRRSRAGPRRETQRRRKPRHRGTPARRRGRRAGTTSRRATPPSAREDDLRQAVYAARINLVQAAFDARDVTLAAARLDQTLSAQAEGPTSAASSGTTGAGRRTTSGLPFGSR